MQSRGDIDRRSGRPRRERNVRWKTAIHDKGWSSPVVWENQVWLTTATEKGDKCYAVAVDRDTGKVAAPGCPRVFKEAFLAGTEPTEVCQLHGF